MIKVEPCKGCGVVLLVDRFMGVAVRCDPALLDVQTAGAALLAGQTLYRVECQGGRPHSFSAATLAVLGALRAEPFERPMVVVAHRCNASAPVSRPISAPTKETPTGACPKAQGPVQTAARGDSVERATPRLSSDPVCDGCGEPMADGTYAAIQLGDLYVWKAHVEACGA